MNRLSCLIVFKIFIYEGSNIMHKKTNRFLRYTSQNYDLLSRNSSHQFAARQALKIFRSNTIYTFIPKNACSTMRVSLAIANMCIRDVTDFNWIHKNNSTFSSSLSDLVEAEYTFVILRSPLTRLASVYLDKIVDRTDVAWHLYDLVKRNINLENITFREFVEIVTNEEYLKLDIHWRPQVDFLVYDDYDDYFTLENFKEATSVIESKTNMTIYDARNLTKHGTDQYLMTDDKCYADIPASEIYSMKRKGIIPSHNSLYTEELKEQVKLAYQEDVLLYDKISFDSGK